MKADAYYLMKIEDALRGHEGESEGYNMVSNYIEVAGWLMPRGWHNLWYGLYKAVLDKDEDRMKYYVSRMMEVSK